MIRRQAHPFDEIGPRQMESLPVDACAGIFQQSAFFSQKISNTLDHGNFLLLLFISEWFPG
jgi:hypothetical protein